MKRKKEKTSKKVIRYFYQVLAWLLEAEDEVAALSDVDTSDVTMVRRQFKVVTWCLL